MLHVWSPEEGTRQACTALECAQLLPRESQAARGTPEEEAQAEAVGRSSTFQPSPESLVGPILLIVP